MTPVQPEPGPAVDVEVEVDVPRRRVDLVAHDIQGVIYYADHDQQVYHIEDLLDERPNPRIVGYLRDSHTFVPNTNTTPVTVTP